MKSPDQKDEQERVQMGGEHRCPTCKRLVAASEQNRSETANFFPFCSNRCKLIDLGAWLDAEYRIPNQPEEPPDQPPNSEAPRTQDHQ